MKQQLLLSNPGATTNSATRTTTTDITLAYPDASTTSTTMITFDTAISLLCLQSYLSGCSSGLPNDGSVGFTQQRLGKVWLLLQHLPGLIHPTTTERRG